MTLPAIWERFNLANYDKLGNAVNGLTAPVIGLITAILLYSALTRQIEANKQQSEAIRQQTKAIEKQIEANNLQDLGNRQQRIQIESEIIFNLMLQVDKYIEQFYYSNPTQKGELNILNGLHAINKFSALMKGTPPSDKGLGNFYQSRILLLIIRSIQQIELRLSSVNLDNELRHSFQEKINILKDSVLKEPLLELLKAVDYNRLKEDDTSKEIRKFVGPTDKELLINFLDSKDPE